jgi:HD-GYP domain-containing protein (c-di-GMP phosphodiesterase class II)
LEDRVTRPGSGRCATLSVTVTKFVGDMTDPAGVVGTEPHVRLAELVAALSLGVDLGFGQPMEHVLRQCLIALRLAELIGLSDADRSTVYYAGLLVNVGCHSDAHEQAKWFGDDIALKAVKYDHDQRSARGAAATLRLIGSGSPPLHRFRVGLEFALTGHREVDGMIARHSALAMLLAAQLGLPGDVQAAVGAAYERWDGRGWPGTLRGDAIPIAARLTQLAEYVEVAQRIGGIDAALELARARAGAQFDPQLASVLCADAAAVFADLDAAQTWQAVISAEPALGVRLTKTGFDHAVRAVADFVDLKSPYMLGHSGAVSSLAARAGAQLRLTAAEIELLRGAGLVHGFGRLGISNSIWDKPGPLGAGEWERVRLHPYLTERILHQAPSLAPFGGLAAQLRERLDGSGYPRGLAGGAIATTARVLGATDAYQSMREPRPHRPARSPDDAARELRAEVKAGRLDADSVEAVLAAAGHRVARRRELPSGLTGREVDVLRLLARGMSSKDIAARLGVTPKTARNHIEHIYTKTGATSRVTASLFAIQHGLVPDEPESGN